MPGSGKAQLVCCLPRITSDLIISRRMVFGETDKAGWIVKEEPEHSCGKETEC